MTDKTQDVWGEVAEIGALIRFARSRCDADTPSVKALNNALDLLGQSALASLSASPDGLVGELEALADGKTWHSEASCFESALEPGRWYVDGHGTGRFATEIGASGERDAKLVATLLRNLPRILTALRNRDDVLEERASIVAYMNGKADRLEKSLEKIWNESRGGLTHKDKHDFEDRVERLRLYARSIERGEHRNLKGGHNDQAG